MADTTDKDRERLTAKTVENIEKERDLMSSISKLAASMSIDFEKHTKSIGSTVKDLTKIDILQTKIRNVTSDTESLQVHILDLLKEKEKYEKPDTKKLESLKLERNIQKEILDKSTSESLSALVAAEEILSIDKKIKSEEESIAKIRANSSSTDKKIADSMKLLEGDRKRLNVLNTVNSLSEKLGISTALNTVKSGAWTKLIEEAWKIFLKMDDSLFSIRKHLGTLRGESKEIESTAKTLAINFAGVGVTFETAAATMNSIVDDFGRLSSYTENIAGTIATFSSQLGIGEKTSTGLLKNLSQISGKTLNSTDGMIGFTKSLSNAAGVPLPKVMEDIAGASDSVRANFRGNTIELIKATVEARRMGLSLESMGKTSESLLEFNSSVNAEMEASVLIGKNLNLNAARRAAFNGDLVKQNEEILKVLKSVGDFEKLNAFQKKSLAAALGKSVEELQSMNQREKERLHILSSGTKEQRELLANYEKQKRMKESEAKDLGKIAEDRIKAENHQQRMAALQQQFNKLIIELSKPILDVIEPIMGIAVKWLPTILEGFSKLLVPLTFISSVINKTTTATTAVSTGLKLWGTPISKIVPSLSRVGSAVFGIGKFAVGVVGFFGKWLSPIGWIITAFQFLSSLFKRFSDIEFVKGDFIGNIWKGIQAVGGAIYDTLIKPFVDVYDWIMEKLGANSPSEIGLRIVDGIKAVGTMLLDALLSPFKMAYDFITELFGKIPDFISSIFKKGIDFAMKLPGMGLLMKAVDSLSGSPNKESTQTQTVNTTKQDDTNQLILEQLKELTSLLKSGAIAVNMDGRKVSETLAYVSSR